MRRKPRPLPARITLALVLVLITAAWNILRLWSSLSLATVLEEYAPWPGPTYIGVTGAVSAALGVLVLYAFLRRVAWAPKALLAGAAVYAAWGWTDRLVIQPHLAAGWQFSLLMTALALAFIAAVVLDPRNRAYFGREAHEREDEDRPTP